MPKKKKEKWVKPRHRAWRRFINFVLRPYIWVHYHAKFRPFKEEGKRQYLVVFNHQTAFDQFFAMRIFKQPLYILASEDLFSNGWVSDIIRRSINPIPIKKQATDPRAIMNCLRVIREGGSLALAPEGNRTYSGKTEYMKPSVVSLAKALKLPIAFMRIEGGYGVYPRWSDKARKGKMEVYVSKVLEPEEYLPMSNEELFDVIRKELWVDEGRDCGEYKSKRLAEYLERVAYVCPDCGLSTFASEKDVITCQKCGKQVRYLPNKRLQGVGFDFPFAFYAQWYDYQSEFVRNYDFTQHTKEPLYVDTVRLSEVILYKNKQLICEQATLSLYGDKVTLEWDGQTLEMPFADISVATVLGRNKLNLYYGGKVYQCKGEKSFNAVKYVQLCYKCKNVLKGEPNDEFLGL